MRIALALTVLTLGLVGCTYDTMQGPARIVYEPNVDPAMGNHCPDVEFQDELEIMYRLSNPRTAPLVASPVLTAKYGWPTVNACSAVINQWLEDVK